MRLLEAMFLVGLAACSNAQAPSPSAPPTTATLAAPVPGPALTPPIAVPESGSYSALLKEDGQTWCAFKDPSDFQVEVEKAKPTDTARVSFAAGKLTELTYQVEAESGDWIVVDKYRPEGNGAVLRRATLLAQDNLQIIQEATIHEGRADPFQVVSVTTLDGKNAALSPDAYLPEVPVRTDVLAIPPVQVVVQMRSQLVGQLCRKVN